MSKHGYLFGWNIFEEGFCSINLFQMGERSNEAGPRLHVVLRGTKWCSFGTQYIQLVKYPIYKYIVQRYVKTSAIYVVGMLFFLFIILIMKASFLKHAAFRVKLFTKTVPICRIYHAVSEIILTPEK